MKYVCGKCLELTKEDEIVRMPFDDLEKIYWCKKCHKKWDKK